MTLFEYIRTHILSFNPAALPILVVAVVLTLVFALLSDILVLLGLAAITVILVIFGDPARKIPLAPGLILSPVDGMVMAVEGKCGLPLIFDRANDQVEHFTRITLRQRLLGCRTLRAPVAGTVVEIIRHASTDDTHTDTTTASSSREKGPLDLLRRTDQVLILIRTENGIEYALDIHAPVIPQQVWISVTSGDRVDAGERLGLIAAYGVIDLYLPDTHILYKAVSQRALAGETVVAVTGGPAPQFKQI